MVLGFFDIQWVKNQAMKNPKGVTGPSLSYDTETHRALTSAVQEKIMYIQRGSDAGSYIKLDFTKRIDSVVPLRPGTLGRPRAASAT
jgi:hypothetical protein